MNPDATFARVSTDPADERFGVLDQKPQKANCYGCGAAISIYEGVLENPEVGHFWGHNTEGLTLGGNPYCLPQEQPELGDVRDAGRYQSRAGFLGCAAKVDPAAVERVLKMRLAAFTRGVGPEDFAEGRLAGGVLATEESP